MEAHPRLGKLVLLNSFSLKVGKSWTAHRYASCPPWPTNQQQSMEVSRFADASCPLFKKIAKIENEHLCEAAHENAQRHRTTFLSR
jgi:hypothetical protein